MPLEQVTDPNLPPLNEELPRAKRIVETMMSKALKDACDETLLYQAFSQPFAKDVSATSAVLLFVPHTGCSHLI